VEGGVRKAKLQAEVLALLRDIEAGRVTIGYVGRSWRDVFAGDVTFRTSNGWTLVVFNDCDSWDYLDHATAPDLRELDFDDVAHGRCNERGPVWGWRSSNEDIWRDAPQSELP
jgi:hypothetical protein